MIGCSKQVFQRYSRDDWISLVAICGSIHQVLRDSLSFFQRLIHASPSDWRVNQLELNYDISDSNSKGAFIIPDFHGSFKLKHLDTIYQIYHKNLPNKGHCLRLEEQINFSNEQHPTLACLPTP